MNPILSIGVSLVNLALLGYTIFFIRFFRRRTTDKKILLFLILGVILDISSTICMIIGSSNGPLTLHGLIGYIALLGMITDTIIISGYTSKNGLQQAFPSRIVKVTTVFYAYWIITYITGLLLVFLFHK